jgi:hypothetical protein
MRRTLLILAPIVVLAALAFWAYGPFSDPPPESRVQAYLEATARGDEGRALGTWQTCCAPVPELEARRLNLTRELAAAGAGPQFRIEFIEWWRTCCEPGIINDPRNAGRARIFVSTNGRSGNAYELVFEVLTKDGAYWGEAAGYPRHDWTLREVYRRGEQSLRRPAIAPLTREDAIRSSRSLAPVPDNATIEAKRVSLADLRTVLGAQDFLPPADPARIVWVVTASGEMGGGPPKAAWSVVVIDADEHIVIGIRFGEPNARPAYFDAFRTGAPGDYLPPPLNRLEVKVIDALARLGVTGQRAQLPYQDASIWAQFGTGSQLFVSAGPTGTRGGDFTVVDERQLAGLRVQRVQYASDPPLRHRFECSADTYEVRGAVPLGFSDMNSFVTGFIRELGCAA